MVGIEVTEAVLSTVDYEKDYAKIYEIIEIVLDEMILENMGIETLNEFTWPYIGIDVIKSLLSITILETPFPSLPNTMAHPPEKSVS